MTDLMSPSCSRRLGRQHQAVHKLLPIGVLANQRDAPTAILRYPINVSLVLVSFLRFVLDPDMESEGPHRHTCMSLKATRKHIFITVISGSWLAIWIAACRYRSCIKLHISLAR